MIDWNIFLLFLGSGKVEFAGFRGLLAVRRRLLAVLCDLLAVHHEKLAVSPDLLAVLFDLLAYHIIASIKKSPIRNKTERGIFL